ncbi:methyltransferase [Sphingopyxis sp. J-6]|uniref:class I SAM-dependent methyltransferase n=1 Tax=Sphingopyxis sp. J-6 TaxID=3122054 RepID=UPI0039843230
MLKPSHKIHLLTVCSLALAGAIALPPMSAAAQMMGTAKPSRPAADIAEDAARKPGMMLRFANVKAGQRVVEILPGGGYYTRVLSAAVGPRGTVVAVIPRESDPLRKLVREPGRGNVKLQIGALADLARAGPADVVWTSRNYHDLKGGDASADLADQVNRAAFAALKPGGTYIVTDHSAAAGSGARDVGSLHRIDAEAVKAEVQAEGFVLDGESDLLANAGDDRTKPVFDPAVQGKTDQFVLRFRKPK